MSRENVSQIYHEGHKALDITGNKTNFGYGTPLCAPENCTILGITDTGKLDDPDELAYGYGVSFKGESGLTYLFWHCLPIFPVWGGDLVSQGQIIAYMGNAGNVYQGGQYVPLSERTSKPYKGTHVHVQVEMNGVRIDPLPLIDFSQQPTYTTLDFMGAYIKILQKQIKLYSRPK